MKDIQNTPADVPISIDCVGVRGVRLPLWVREHGNNSKGRQRTVADVDAGVNLLSDSRGTHMSRFISLLQDWAETRDILDYTAVKELLGDMRGRLEAQSATVTFRFPFFMMKKAPATDNMSLSHYDCRLAGSWSEGMKKPEFELGVVVPVMTVCPCSKAISREGAHSQRTELRLNIALKGFVGIEELIAIGEASASSPVYTLLKRPDEKYVTEAAFSRPMFVEDVVRGAAKRLQTHPRIGRFVVDAESFESIHAHNAFARIEGHGPGGASQKLIAAQQGMPPA